MTPVMSQIKTVVVLVLENRSLDNLLGFLYGADSKITPYPPGSSSSFDGVPAGTMNEWKGKSYYVTNGTQSSLGADPLQQPNFDPHEEFEHVTKQLYADGNGKMPSGDFWATAPPMTGFAWDYSSLVDNNQSVMGSYSSAQLPALHGLAKNYAVSDRWFSSVPTQTFANRAYQLCGTSLGAVDNSEIVGRNIFGIALDNPCPFFKDTKTLFNALGDAGKTWGIYWRNDGGPAAGSAAGAPYTPWLCAQIANARNGGVYRVIDDTNPDSFKNRLKAGTLPNFCFVEPKWGGGIVGGTFTTIQGNDFHPPAWVGPAEWSLNNIYNAIISSPQWKDMLLVITFDEHGGTYDHVPPPRTISPDGIVGKSGFTFERLGVRVPTLLVSPYVPPGVVFRSPDPNHDFDHTSLIATMLKWAGIDPATAGMGQRVSIAPTFEGVLSTTARTTAPTFNVPPGYAFQGGYPGWEDKWGESSNIREFTGGCGQNSAATSAEGLQPYDKVSINGSTDLSGCVQFNDSGKVYGISLARSPGIYDYVVSVDAEGPHGAFSGSGYLAFTDQTGDTYKLSIFSSKRSVHTVRYNSQKPGIVKIQWNNHSI